jgi:hypothetical protein
MVIHKFINYKLTAVSKKQTHCFHTVKQLVDNCNLGLSSSVCLCSSSFPPAFNLLQPLAQKPAAVKNLRLSGAAHQQHNIGQQYHST